MTGTLIAISQFETARQTITPQDVPFVQSGAGKVAGDLSPITTTVDEMIYSRDARLSNTYTKK